MRICTALFFPKVAVGLLISQPLPAKSVAGPEQGHLLLILVQMIDSSGATTTASVSGSLSEYSRTICSREKKGEERKQWMPGRKATTY